MGVACAGAGRPALAFPGAAGRCCCNDFIQSGAFSGCTRLDIEKPFCGDGAPNFPSCIQPGNACSSISEPAVIFDGITASPVSGADCVDRRSVVLELVTPCASLRSARIQLGNAPSSANSAQGNCGAAFVGGAERSPARNDSNQAGSSCEGVA